MSPEIDKNPTDLELAEASFSIRPDDGSPWGRLINGALRKAGRTERFRKISTESLVIAEGIWTMENAIRITNGIRVQKPGLGGDFFRAPKEDFEHCGNEDDSHESFWVEPEVIKILIDSGVFKKNSSGERYSLVYPEGYVEECGICGVFVNMTHQPIEGDTNGRERMTLYFMS